MSDAQKPQLAPELVAAFNVAMAKQRAGQKLKREDQRAIAQVKAETDEHNRRQHYAAVRKKDYVRLSGRQHKVLDEQAILYDLPLGDPTIDLGRVLRRFHDILAEHGEQFRAEHGGPPDTDELLRQERLRAARLENQEKLHQLLPQPLVHYVHQQMAARLRLAGEQLQKGFGQGALEILLDAITDLEALINQVPQPKADDGKEVQN